jgi:hypothetical protein
VLVLLVLVCVVVATIAAWLVLELSGSGLGELLAPSRPQTRVGFALPPAVPAGPGDEPETGAIGGVATTTAVTRAPAAVVAPAAPGQTVVLVGDDVEAWVRERLYGGRPPAR